MPRTPSRPAALRRAPFLGSEAVRAGLLTKGQLRSRAWRRLFRDVYVDARVAPDHAVAIRGAALLLPDGMAVAGRSAAHLYGAALAGADDEVTVAGPVAWRGPAGIRPRQRSFAATDLRTFHGIPVTTPLATSYELARDLPLDEAVVWLGALARARALRRDQIAAYAARLHGRPGWQGAARAIDLCDPRAESPPESRVRLRLVLAGLPPPVPQYAVLDNGEFVARVDLAWPAWKIALEYDGQWHADPGQLGRDRRRIRQLNALAGMSTRSPVPTCTTSTRWSPRSAPCSPAREVPMPHAAAPGRAAPGRAVTRRRGQGRGAVTRRGGRGPGRRYSSRWARSGAKAGRQMATYSAPSESVA